MKKIAFLFPGQGSQVIGMGKDIYENYEEARAFYEKANQILGFDIAKLCFEGPEEELNQTQNTQIAILVTSLAIVEVLKKYGITASICTGLSLGEYSALIYSGILGLEEGLRLVQKRGYYMGNYIPKEEYKMVAVMGLQSSIIEEICTQIDGFVMPSNYNYSGQTVISGNKEAVEKAEKVLQEKGARKLVTLKTSGPFHTKKLEQAKELFEKELDKISFYEGEIPVIKNIDGKVYQKEDDKKKILASHIVSPVRFDKTIQTMKQEDIDIYVEVGPGKALSGFVKKEDKEVTVITISNIETLQQAITILK